MTCVAHIFTGLTLAHRTRSGCWLFEIYDRFGDFIAVLASEPELCLRNDKDFVPKLAQLGYGKLLEISDAPNLEATSGRTRLQEFRGGQFSATHESIHVTDVEVEKGGQLWGLLSRGLADDMWTWSTAEDQDWEEVLLRRGRNLTQLQQRAEV